MEANPSLTCRFTLADDESADDDNDNGVTSPKAAMHMTGVKMLNHDTSSTVLDDRSAAELNSIAHGPQNPDNWQVDDDPVLLRAKLILGGMLTGRELQLAAMPVVWAKRDGAYLEFRCPHCQRVHSHGGCCWGSEPGCECRNRGDGKTCTCPAGEADGHRWAHCGNDSSPYEETGYYVREAAA